MKKSILGKILIIIGLIIMVPAVLLSVERVLDVLRYIPIGFFRQEFYMTKWIVISTLLIISGIVMNLYKRWKYY